MQSGSSGADYEETAARWLQKNGLRLLQRNFSARTGEIDIIALQGDCLVFIEVRSRSNPRYPGAAASVNRRKQGRIVRTAQIFLQSHPQWADRRCRFDVIAFEPPQSGARASPHWIRGAFTA